MAQSRATEALIYESAYRGIIEKAIEIHASVIAHDENNSSTYAESILAEPATLRGFMKTPSARFNRRSADERGRLLEIHWKNGPVNLKHHDNVITFHGISIIQTVLTKGTCKKF